jgi:site-specific recombinase XerC
MERSRKDVAEFIQSHYRRTDMSMLELTPEFIKDFAAYLSTGRGLANGTIWQRCMWLKGVVLRAHYNGKIPRNPFATLALSKGMPIESVSRVLGHTNIVTTQIYAKNTSQKLNADLTMLGDKLNTSFKSIK